MTTEEVTLDGEVLSELFVEVFYLLSAIMFDASGGSSFFVGCFCACFVLIHSFLDFCVRRCDSGREYCFPVLAKVTRSVLMWWLNTRFPFYLDSERYQVT